VLGHIGTDANRIDGQLARQGSAHPLIRPEPALVTSATFAKGVIRGGQAGNTRSIGSPFINAGRLRAFLKDPLLKELGNYST
jgi:hypothetical protein